MWNIYRKEDATMKTRKQEEIMIEWKHEGGVIDFATHRQYSDWDFKMD